MSVVTPDLWKMCIVGAGNEVNLWNMCIMYMGAGNEVPIDQRYTNVSVATPNLRKMCPCTDMPLVSDTSMLVL